MQRLRRSHSASRPRMCRACQGVYSFPPKTVSSALCAPFLVCRTFGVSSRRGWCRCSRPCSPASVSQSFEIGSHIRYAINEALELITKILITHRAYSDSFASTAFPYGTLLSCPVRRSTIGLTAVAINLIRCELAAMFLGPLSSGARYERPAAWHS